MPTYPDMYPRSEVAKLNAEEVYEIDYMGVPKPAPGAWSANNFMYTPNLFFTNKFYRIVAQGRDSFKFDEHWSGVRKLQYGNFTDEAIMDSDVGKYKGLHGMTKAPYQDGEMMKLYIAVEENQNLSEAEFVEDILDVAYTGDISDFKKALYKNMKEVNFVDLDNAGQITTLDGVNDQTGLKSRLNTIYLYKYGSVEGFIQNGDGYRDFANSDFLDLSSGQYEVVIPIYWNRNVPENMSSPDVFSRNRYKYDDTIHFTMNLTVPTSSISLEKTTNIDTYSKVGNVINYTFAITNTGETELEGSFQIFDDKLGEFVRIRRLAPGNTWLETIGYMITQADIDAGSITNVAYAVFGNIVTETVEKTVEYKIPDTIEVFKSAYKTGICREFGVILDIIGTPSTDKPIDVILVIDKSGSMRGDKITAAKIAAKDFATKVLAKPNNQVAIVTYDDSASINFGLSSNLDDIINVINSIQAGGNTNIESGLIKAEEALLDSREKSQKAIVLLSDGIANRSVSDLSGPFEGDHNKHTTAAYLKGISLHSKAQVFTIGLGVGNDPVAVDTLVRVAQGENYYSAPSSDDLAYIYKKIAKKINYSATDALVVDKIADGFKLVEGSLETINGSVSENSGVITWTPGIIRSEASLRYKIVAKPETAGLLETNEYATLTYTNISGDENIKKNFPKPMVEVSEPLKVTLSDATITRGTSIALGSGGYGGNLMTITGGTQDPTNDQRDLTYSWSIKDQDEFSTVENPEVSPRVDTEYRVIIEDDYGCTATATMMVFVRAPYVPPTPETVDVAANKVWVGGPAVKPTIELQLYRNDEVVDGSLATLENGTTTYTWNGLRRYDPAGVEYIYTVKEVTQLDNYTKVEVGLTVTNTFIEEVERVDITGNKIWILGPEIKPVIELQLYRNGIAYGDPVELLDGTTSYTWTGLEKVDIEGNDYTYTIDEVSTPENYDKLVSDDGLTVTNIFFEVAGDVVIDDTEKPPVDKTPPTGINNFISLYTTTLVLGSAGLIYLAKRKEEEF